MSGTSIYVHRYSVRYISYGGFQTKVYKIGGCYSVRMTKKGKVGSLQKLYE